jgi:hypothetical protein
MDASQLDELDLNAQFFAEAHPVLVLTQLPQLSTAN